MALIELQIRLMTVKHFYPCWSLIALWFICLCFRVRQKAKIEKTKERILMKSKTTTTRWLICLAVGPSHACVFMFYYHRHLGVQTRRHSEPIDSHLDKNLAHFNCFYFVRPPPITTSELLFGNFCPCLWACADRISPRTELSKNTEQNCEDAFFVWRGHLRQGHSNAQTASASMRRTTRGRNTMKIVSIR